MNIWQEFNGSPLEWDEYIIRNEGNYRQLYEWGRLQEDKGWKVYRFLKKDNDTFHSSIQILCKNFIFFRFLYLPGGVTGNEAGFGDLEGLIKKIVGNLPFYIRLDSNYEYDKTIVRKFLSASWSRPVYFLNSARTLYVDLDIPEEILIDHKSRNWKKNIKKSKKFLTKIYVDTKITSTQIKSASADMQKHKNIFLRDDPANISNIIKFFEKDILIVYCCDEEKNILGFRSALIKDKRAWEFYAATTKVGRSQSIGFALLDKLIKECRDQGVKKFILPLSKTNEGDTEFKKGSGGKQFKLIGEWEYSNVYFLKTLINFSLYILYSSSTLAYIKKGLRK